MFESFKVSRVAEVSRAIGVSNFLELQSCNGELSESEILSKLQSYKLQ